MTTLYRPGLPLFITSFDPAYACTNQSAAATAGAAGVNNWPSANLAMIGSLVLPFTYPVRRVFWVNGSSVTGNADMGIYRMDGTRVYSTGATAQSGVSQNQFVATNLLLPAGEYFWALSTSATSSYFVSTASVSFRKLQGQFDMATAHPLPATLTLATPGNARWPLFGITLTTSGFTT